MLIENVACKIVFQNMLLFLFREEKGERKRGTGRGGRERSDQGEGMEGQRREGKRGREKEARGGTRITFIGRKLHLWPLNCISWWGNV